MMKRINISIGVAWLFMAAVACQKEAPKSSQLSLSISVDAATKAVPINNMFDFNSYLNTFPFKVYDEYRCVFPASAKREGSTWVVPPFAWPTGQSYDIVALAGADADGVEVSVESWIPDSKVYSFNYSISSIPASNQPDLMAGYYSGEGENGNAQLHFSHLLTGVRFVSSMSESIKILSVGFVNVCSSASCCVDFSAGVPLITWNTTNASIGDFRQDINEVTPAQSPVTSPDQTFMLIPQTVPDDAYAYVMVDRGGVPSMQKVSLAGKTWNPGEIVTYELQAMKSTVMDMDRYRAALQMLQYDVTNVHLWSVLSPEEAEEELRDATIYSRINIEADSSSEEVVLYEYSHNGDGQILMIIVSDADRIFTTSDCSAMFKDFSSLWYVSLSRIDMSSATDISEMFMGCTALEHLAFSGLNTSGVEDLSSMFEGCTSLQSLTLESFNTASALNFERMFYGCSNLSSIDFGEGFMVLAGSVNDMMCGACSAVSGRVTLKLVKPLWNYALSLPQANFGFPKSRISFVYYH